MVKAYVASPLGFSEAGRLFYYGELLPRIQEYGFEVLDPWKLTPNSLIQTATRLPYGEKKRSRWRAVDKIMGRNNAEAIKVSQIVIAVLDGVDVDSGTASEIGYAAAIGKAIEGYRGDYRLSADNIGTSVNLQVEYFIALGGGIVTSTLEKLEKRLGARYEELKPRH